MRRLSLVFFIYRAVTLLLGKGKVTVSDFPSDFVGESLAYVQGFSPKGQRSHFLYIMINELPDVILVYAENERWFCMQIFAPEPCKAK